MGRRLLRWSAVAVCLSAASCAYLGELSRLAELDKVFEQPKLELVSADLTRVTLGGAELTTKWKLHNPNGIGLNLASVDYALEVEGVKVVSGKPAAGLEVPANGSTELTFPADVRFSGLASTLVTFLTKDSAKYTVKGSVGLNTPVGVVALPLALSGDFQVPKIPDVKLENPKVTALSVSGATIELPLVLTNKTKLPLPIDGLGGELSIAGARVGRISTADFGTLDATGKKTLKLPITINFLSAGMAVARLIQGGAGDVALEATMKSGEAEVPIGLSQTVRFERDKF